MQETLERRIERIEEKVFPGTAPAEPDKRLVATQIADLLRPFKSSLDRLNILQAAKNVANIQGVS